MSPITKYWIAVLLLIAGLLFLSACGSEKNRNSPFDADEDQHAAGWLPAGHKTAAQENEDACTECHGSDFSGGVSKVSCTSCHLGGVNSVHPLDWGTSIDAVHGTYVDANANTACANTHCHGSDLGGVTDSGPSCTSCHLGGVNSVHPLDWGTSIDSLHGAYVDTNGSTACANAACHGTTLTGGTGGGPSCTSCHLGGGTSIHPASFGTGTQIILNHAPYVLTNGASGCATAACHGTNLNGGVGPACVSCHLKGSPLVLTDCTSCHGKPPSGTVSPNRAGAHNASTGHFAAQIVLPDECNTCHNGAGSGTPNHDNGVVDVSLLSAYNAKSGTAVHNADGTCSKVSCHGGQTTPVWLTGTIDVGTQCTSCHAFGTTEYNSYVSGQHGFHVNVLQLSCLDCHDKDKLAVNHFTTLNTSALEGPASATLNSNVNYDGTSCTPLCHGKDTWQ
jgi:predicted CxxxxCH...CXXCH cytochrome family protein